MLESGDRPLDFPREELDQSVVHRFEEIASRWPDRIAICSNRQNLSYGELNKAANQVAHAIAKELDGSRRPVAILMEEDVPIVTAFIGVLKSGSFFVPLDRSFPRARQAWLLRDCGAPLVLTDSRQLTVAEELARDRTHVSNIDGILSGVSAENPAAPAAADDPAWLVYTSGSTGEPKGVIWDHRSVLHSAMTGLQLLQLTEADRVAHVLSCCLAAGVNELFTALLSGAPVFRLDVKREGVADLAGWLRDHAITHLLCVTTLFRQFLATLMEAGQFPRLRAIRVGGEPLYKSDVEAFRRLVSPPTDLIHRLASTEAGTVRLYVVDRETELDGDLVPVGYPVEGKEVLLLDEGGREVPCGEVGEICVKSAFLPRDYWCRPDLTAASFRPADGARIFHSGDLGRMTGDGCLYHVGRKDSLVKIRGYRVALPEIEAALREQAGVLEAVVVAREGEPGEQRLLAYFVPSSEPAPSGIQLRKALESKLPEHMVPTAIVQLASMPMTVNGKLDRGALPEPVLQDFTGEVEYTAPRGEAESQLVKIWEAVLGVRSVSVTHNFFDLGGNSLLASRLLLRIEQVFEMKLSLGTLLEAPTVESLAAALRQDIHPASEIVEIQPQGSRPPFIMVGAYPIYRHVAARLGRDQPFFGLVSPRADRLPPGFDVRGFAARLVAAIRRRQPDGPYFLGGWCAYGALAYETAWQLSVQGEEVALLVLFDTYRPGSAWQHPLRKSPWSRVRNQIRRFRFRYENFRQLGEQELMAYFSELPGRAVKAMRTEFLQPNRQRRPGRTAIREYRPEPYSGRIVLFRADEGLRTMAADAWFGWRGFAQGGIEVHDVRGHHFNMFVEPNVDFLASKLSICLTDAQNALSRRSVSSANILSEHQGGDSAGHRDMRS